MRKATPALADAKNIVLASSAAALAVLSGCAGPPVQMGAPEAKTVATGAAAGASSTNANSQLERCDRSFGTVAVVEDQAANWYAVLTREYRLTSTVPVLRLLIQQSNCFIVVERGRAMANMQQERQLQQSGELRQGSNFGKGQMVSADYSITPEVLFSAKDASGIGGALGGLGRGMGVIGAVVGGIRTNEAATLLNLTDNRSGVQVASAEGSSSKTDIDLGIGVFGRSGGAALGGYTNTPQGKVIAAAFTDSYNQLVRALRNYSPQTMGDRGLGTGGRLGVDGSSVGGPNPSPPPAPAAPPPPRAAAPQTVVPQAVVTQVATAPAVVTPVAPVIQPAPPAVAMAAPTTMTLADAQRKLAALGYNPGPADGAMGSRTTTALRTFQKDRKLPITGRLDEVTIAELAR